MKPIPLEPVLLGLARPRIQVNNVPVVTINQRCHGPTVHEIQPSTRQRVSGSREIMNRRRKIEAAPQPQLHYGRVARLDIEQVRFHLKHEKMRREYLLRIHVVIRPRGKDHEQIPPQRRQEWQNHNPRD